MAKTKIRVALTGNPNVGKTTIFNAITGARQKVGNWPGVTVEKKVGTKEYAEHTLEIVDLPGTYSLTAYSADEVIARDYILEE
ncbi:MAG: ferrous iron transport protein, partial [Euryarchaeota archaeon]|nr:ferrous iron transport protein [Euryarchaeota archaeon]